MNEFEFPTTTAFHPSGLVMDEHSVERSNWFGEQTMHTPQTLYTFYNNYENPKWALFFRNYATNDLRPSVVGRNANGGWWHHNLTFIAQNLPYGYLQVEQVHGFMLEGRTGDYTIVKRLFVALRTDGKLDVLVDGNTNPVFAIQQPAPPTLQDNHTYTPQQLVEWEEAFLVSCAIPKASISPPIIRSTASNMIRILRDPKSNTTLNITLSHPDPTNHEYLIYLFVGGQAFFVEKKTNTFTQITIPKNDTLFLKGVNFRFFADNQEMFTATNEKLTGMLSLGNRMVYWGQKGVYISSKNFPFLFGTEEGYTPQEGDGAFVSLPNVLFCMEVGSTIIAFTPKKAFRIVEAGQGIWVAIEADYPPPLLKNSQPLYRGHLYRSTASLVDASSGEPNYFGMRFKLLEFSQVCGLSELGMGLGTDGQVFVWENENIYTMVNETADFIFVDAGKFYMVRGTSSNLVIKEWEPVGFDTSPPKYTRWVYIKSFPSEVYMESFYVRLMGVSTCPFAFTVENFDNPSEQIIVSGTLVAGLNKIILPKRLRASVFKITFEAGGFTDTGDYMVSIVGTVRALERLKGGLSR
ncbi:MAG: hypothetical protein QXO09_06220 [Candidatus Caldarchaeum sp.]